MSEPTPGNWRPGKTADSVVSDTLPTDPQQLRGWDQEAWDYYGGYLIAECVDERDRPIIVAAKKTAEDRDRLLSTSKTLLADIDAGGIIDCTPMRDVIAEAEGDTPPTPDPCSVGALLSRMGEEKPS